MNKLSDNFLNPAQLRERAENVLKSKQETTADRDIDKSRLLHELQVHQIELEMQIESLLVSCRIAEQALERYTRLFEDAPIAYLLVSREGLIRQTNRRGEVLLGGAGVQITGQPFINRVSLNYRPAFTRLLQQVFANTHSFCCDLSLEIGNRLKWVKMDARANADQQTCLLTLTETTQERKAFDDLEQSNKEFRQLAEAIPQIVWVTSADGKNIYFNQLWEDYTGLTQAQSLGDRWIIPFHADDRQLALDAWRNAVAMRGDYSLECRLRRADGAYKWWLIRGLPVFDDKGSITKWIGTCTDIHQLKITEQSLREAEARWQFALEGSHQGVWDWDIPTGKIFYSSQWKAMIGYADHEISDQVEEWSERVHPDDLQAAREDLQKHWRGETPYYQNKHRVRNRQGDYLWVLARGMVMSRDAAGKPLRIIGVRQDVTAQHKLLEQLQNAESQTRAIMDSLESSIAVTNERGEIIRTNRGWRNFALENGGEGLLRENQRLNYFDVLRNAGDLPEATGILEGLRAVLAGRQPFYSFEYPCRSAEKQLWFRLEASPLIDSTPGLVMLHIDITERKKAEMVFRVLFDQSNVGLAQINSETGGFVRVNHAYTEIIGYSAEEMLDLTFMRITHPEDLQADLGQMHRLKTGEIANFRLEKRLIHKDGSEIWIELNVSPLWLSDIETKFHLASIQDITTRKQAELRLQHSETRYRSLFENSLDAIFVNRGGSQIEQVNRACLNLWRADQPEDLLGKNPLTLFHPDYHQLVMERFQQATANQTAQPYLEKRIIRFDGSVADVLVSDIPFADERRGLQFVVLRDITQQKQAEHALKTSRNRLETFVKQAPICIAMFDRNMNYLVVSENWSMEFNRGYQNLIGRNHYAVHPDLPAEWKIIHQKGLAGEYLSNENNHWLLEDGREFWLRWTVSPWTDELGNIGGIIIYSENITDHKLTEEKLIRSETQLRFITDHAPILITHCDTEKRYKFVNQTYADLYGLQPADIVGKHPREILGKETYAIAKPYMNSVLSGREISYDLKLPSTSQGPRVVSVHYLPERDAEGGVVGFIAAISDITQRKEAENSLLLSHTKYQELSSHLESVREEERTRIAREIHDDLGSFMTVLKMDLSWLYRHLPAELPSCQEKTRLLIRQADECIQTVKRMINDLRPSILDHLGLFPAIEWIIEDFRKRTGMRCLLTLPKLDVVLETEPSTAVFRILQEALTNILSHAQASQVNITVAVRKNQLVMTVTDNGRGINLTQDRLSRSFGVQGMQERARYFGGHLNIGSRPGAGTTVKLSMPLPAAEAGIA